MSNPITDLPTDINTVITFSYSNPAFVSKALPIHTPVIHSLLKCGGGGSLLNSYILYKIEWGRSEGAD